MPDAGLSYIIDRLVVRCLRAITTEARVRACSGWIVPSSDEDAAILLEKSAMQGVLVLRGVG